MQHDPLLHVKYQIEAAPLRQWTFPHCLVENLLPDDLVDDLLDHMPEDDDYDHDEFGRSNSDERFRTIIRVTGNAEKMPASVRGWWDENMGWFTNGSMVSIMADKFGVKLTKDVGFASMLIRDHAGYALGPHADHPQKIITCVIYMPRDEVTKDHHGTSIYKLKNQKMTLPDDASHWSSDAFKRIATAPYKRNSALLFLRQPDSWHGVEPSFVTRDTLQIQAITL